MSNIAEFTKAFNLMIALHGKIRKALEIIDDGSDKIGLYEDSIIGFISEEFKQITKVTSDLINSKKIQFFAESNIIHKNP